jgi:hypothetical protein
MKVTLPGQTTTVDTQSGVDPIWYEKLQAIAKIVNAYDALFSAVDPSTLTDGQVLVWSAADKKFKPGAN